MQMAVPTDYDSLFKLYQQAQIEILQLKQQLQQLQKMIFSAKSERFIPSDATTSQLSLDIQAESIANCSLIHAKKISYVRNDVTVQQKPLSHPGRMKLPGSLRREEIIIEPNVDTKR